MGDRAPRSIPASLEVRESQRNMAADASARGRIALGSPESALVDRERIGVSPSRRKRKPHVRPRVAQTRFTRDS